MPPNASAQFPQRAVVTGMGVVSVLGSDVHSFYQSLMAGRSGIEKWKLEDARCLSKIGGDLSDFNFQNFCDTSPRSFPEEQVKKAKRLLRNTPLAGTVTMAACLQAYTDGGFFQHSTDLNAFGHILAGHNLNQGFCFKSALAYLEEPEYIEPLYGLNFLDTDVLAVVNDLLCLKGPSYTVGGACASSNLALLNALNMIRFGQVDKILVTGSVFDVDSVALQGWGIMDAISFKTFNGEPSKASRPFDARREGFVPSHAAGAVILESLESAKKRGAVIHAEILGGACNSDGSRLTKPCKEGQVRVILDALKNARVSVEQIDYINAHATSTPMGDAVEVSAIKQAFQSHAYKIPVNSTKSMTGHALSSASMIELIAGIMQMNNGTVHPTINQEEKDPELDLDFVSNQGREHKIGHFMSNSFGFGGFNSSIIVGKST